MLQILRLEFLLTTTELEEYSLSAQMIVLLSILFMMWSGRKSRIKLITLIKTRLINALIFVPVVDDEIAH